MQARYEFYFVRKFFSIICRIILWHILKKYMHKIILSVFVLFSFQGVFAQQTAIEKVSDSACHCLTAIKDSIKTSADFETRGQGCIIKAMLAHVTELAKEEGINVDDLINENDDSEVLGEQIGTKIGINLVTNCPDFLELVMKYDTDEESEGEVVKGSISGVISKVEKEDQLYLHIKESSGKITKLIWLEYFPGADDYKADPEKLKGKEVTANWRMLELYSLKQKDFILSKTITKLVVE